MARKTNGHSHLMTVSPTRHDSECEGTVLQNTILPLDFKILKTSNPNVIYFRGGEIDMTKDFILE